MAKKRKKMSASERRAQLIKVSRAVFAEKGYEGTTTQELADNAGVSKPIIYEHFGGKEGLHAVIVDREIDYVVTRISAALGRKNARERLEGAASVMLTYVRDHPDGFRVLSHSSPHASGSSSMSSLLSEVAERVASLFSKTFSDAGYDDKLAPMYAHALVGMVSYVGQWWMEDQSLPMETVASHLAAIAWLGLRNLPSKPDQLPLS